MCAFDRQYLSLVGTIWLSTSQSVAIRVFNTQGFRLNSTYQVLLTELTKIVLVCLTCWTWLRKTPFPGPIRWGYLVPVFLYTGTNLLTYRILERVDVGIYTVLAQHKILLVACLSSLVLKRKYTRRQWASCLVMMFGIAYTQAEQLESTPTLVIGSLIVAQGVCSSLAGIWMEKMMKKQSSDPFYFFLTDSLQMYLMSLPWYLCLWWTMPNQAHTLTPSRTFALAVNGACGGLFIGSIFKFYSSLVRSYVQCISVIIVMWVSVSYLGESFTWEKCVGTMMVISSVLMYTLNKGG
jgi:drug/metabolite transporter (DMT)-like permease